MSNNIRLFFEHAAMSSRTLLRLPHYRAKPAAKILDLALGHAMVSPSYAKKRVLPRFRLKNGEGRQARAQLLAASARVLGPPSSSMSPGESVREWLESGFSKLKHDQIVRLLEAAAAEQITPEALEARAR